jgi:hypothetical protein
VMLQIRKQQRLKHDVFINNKPLYNNIKKHSKHFKFSI